eukprot:GHVS01075661.1.p1 GENE.GHVS01075661.1~~GHVS01075661.1.p1  ORF type:complete len:350 (+),score=70.50 GHVS01075661.1:172-1221(+)
MDDSSLEYVLLNKREVFVYKIPPRSPQGHRAEDWKECIWRGKLQVVARGDTCAVKLLDVNTGKLFAQCPVTENYEQSVERTVDSSRYFALRVDDGGGRHAFIGMGFESRNDAFDLNCALSDYARRRQVELQGTTSDTPSDVPQRDYRLKEGEKIKVELKGLKGKPRSRTQGSSSSAASPSLTPFPSPPVGPDGNSPLLAVPPPPPAKHRAVRREKSPFDDSGGLLDELLTEPSRTSQQPTVTSNDLLDLEFTDFQAATPADAAAAPPPPPHDSPSDIPRWATSTNPAETYAGSDPEHFTDFGFASAETVFISSTVSLDVSSSSSLSSDAPTACSPVPSVSSDAPHLSVG